MPRQRPSSADASPFLFCEASPEDADAGSLPAAGSEPRDWSELGRRVLAEAQRRATDELVRRGAVEPASGVSRLRPESWS